ncbi:tape measure protein [Klebsiella quasipneumoniae]|uniref:tape measure protein n=1 Tax=Klebsiella quasipneumoniae TaxID=1463165 RepID=UPI00109C2185|nr:tape measure protein [Klebsiella quasipneumoniae]MBR7467347.1 tape measure protein [Klebsiella quasipneumoniae]MBV0687693.1 tape measure protein [Klebsiella quasipneumoniae]MCJ4906307.1 tape measure protein [Klebsiella quasipneumoniae]MDZ0892376.1 tape measure protein [Klebsiella quasipneumoniae]UDC63039.1 tape measure protein [Klebsiella quasipneumoniae subsp. quasipneumoniae]
MAENAGGIYYDIEMDVRGLLTAQQRVNQRLDLMERGFDKTSRSIDTTERSMSSLSRVAVALTAALSVQQVAEYADAWATVNNKLSNSLRPSEQLADVTERVFNITQQTRSSLDATASLYARLERATRQYGTSAGDLAKLTTIINQGFVVSGATAQEAENAIIQLSQGLASGALRGEEFNSVNEQGNRLIVALADSMGVSIGQMRNMAAQGKLTTDVVVNGLLSQGTVIGAEFANTTTTISQALQVAGNNITKFFGENSTVKTGAAIFSDAVVTISENIGGLSALLTGVAAILGSRYVGAITMATAAKIKAAAASRTLSAEESLAAQAAANKAAADLRAAAVAKERALDEIRLAEMMRLTAISETNAAAAEQRLSVARVAAAGAVDNYNRALAANRAAQMALSSGASLASRALGLIGGPAGAAMLAASAILYFSQRAKEARNDANALADSVNDLSSKFQTMSHTELAATIGKLSQSLPELSDAVSDAQKEFNDATSAVQRQQREIANWGTNTTRGRQAAEALSGAQDNLAIATLELEKAQNRLSQTQNAINIGRATLNGTMKQGIDLLRRDGQEAGIAAGMMGRLGDMINFAAKAKDKFNSSSLLVERPKDVQEYLDKLQDQVTLQSELNDRKRAQLRAEQDIRNLGGSEADVNLARDRAAAEFDALQAQQNNKKATKESASEAKKLATQQESVAQKLANLKQQSELAAGSTQELSREQTILRAQQSLGKSATQAQIQEAGKYAAAAWDAAAAAKGVTEALNAIPEQAENKSYAESMQNLKAALNAGKIDLQEYNAATEQMEQQHQANLAKIRSQQVVNPTQQAIAEVDPVQQLANQHAQELALIQQFEQQGVIAHTQALALKKAADTQYEQERTNAQWALFTQQSVGYEALGAAVDAFGSQASNALTGVITGSMSANDALRSIGNTILNDVINTFVQMGMQQAKSAVMGATAQNAAIATTTAAQVSSLATTTAASTSSAAATTAAWTPAALVASIGSFGGAVAIGLGALVAALAVGSSLAGKRKNGGPVSAGSMYQVGEDGKPEIYQASTGKQYMIPGDNGAVISNKDLQGSGGGTLQVVNNVYNYANGVNVDTRSSQNGGQLVIETFITDMQTGGPMSSQMQDTFGLRRQAHGDY